MRVEKSLAEVPAQDPAGLFAGEVLMEEDLCVPSDFSTCSRDARVDNACLSAYQRELNFLLRVLERFGVDGNDVEDLAQEIFLVLRNKWGSYDESRPLRPFLFGIAFRVASVHKRRKWREVPFAFIEKTAGSPTPDREFEAREARQMVLAALQEIPLTRRAVLIMHDIDQVSVQDVALSLSIPIFTVYSRLRKARCELVAAIERLQRTRRSLRR